MTDFVFKEDKKLYKSEIDKTFDREWISNVFLLSDAESINKDRYNHWVMMNRFYCTADSKITATSPGMTMACNPKPQFTRYADPRSKGLIKSRPDITVTTGSHRYGLGLGHHYSNAYDDTAQRVFFQFGTVEHTNFLVWMAKAFDADQARLATRGMLTQAVINGVKIVAGAFALFAFPLLSLSAIAINAIVQNTRFSKVSDGMYAYWSSVEYILNHMVARRTMTPMFMKSWSIALDGKMQQTQSVGGRNESDIPKTDRQHLGYETDAGTLSARDESFVDKLNTQMPNLISRQTGKINMFALAFRFQAAYNETMGEEQKRLEANETIGDGTSERAGFGYSIDPNSDNWDHDTWYGPSEDKIWFLDKVFTKAYNLLNRDTGEESIYDTRADTVDFAAGTNDRSSSISKALEEGAEGTISMDPTFELEPEWALDFNSNESVTVSASEVSEKVASNARRQYKKGNSWLNKFGEYAAAELKEGSLFAVFEVNSTGSIGESFDNQTASNPLEATFNSVSSKARSYTTNIKSVASGIPLVSDFIDSVADVATSALSAATFGMANPLLALAYGVQVNMPKQWESAGTSLPKANYSFRLVAPYNNAYCQLFTQYLPMAMLMAGSMARSTGKATSTAPPMCRVFDRGRLNYQLGVIDSLSFTRGTSTLAFNRAGQSNAIDVDFSVANLDEHIALDIVGGGVFDRAWGAISTDMSNTPFVDYINAITGVDVYDQVIETSRVRLNAAQRYMELEGVLIRPDPAVYAAFSTYRMNLLKNVFGRNARVTVAAGN